MSVVDDWAEEVRRDDAEDIAAEMAVTPCEGCGRPSFGLTLDDVSLCQPCGFAAASADQAIVRVALPHGHPAVGALNSALSSSTSVAVAGQENLWRVASRVQGVPGGTVFDIQEDQPLPEWVQIHRPDPIDLSMAPIDATLDGGKAAK